jgi:hypothetical protein
MVRRSHWLMAPGDVQEEIAGGSACVDTLLERGEEALAHRVVVGVAHAPHRGPDAGLSTAPAKGHRRILTALVGMMNDIRRAALGQGHVQRRQDEVRPEMGVHRPADNAPTPRIEHNGEKEEAGPGRHVRDVHHPEPVGARGRELPLDEIGRRPGPLVADRRRERLAAPRIRRATRLRPMGTAAAMSSARIRGAP